MIYSNKNIILITGGVRSGKSSFAEKIARDNGGKVAFIATAQALDKEMHDRINKHRAHRPTDWRTYEEPYNILPIIKKIGQQVDVILLDCLTLLVSNLMTNYQEGSENQEINENIMMQVEGIINQSLKSSATLIIVSNEVGLGLVPVNPLGRFFRDTLGKANQFIAANSAKVYLMVAGIPILIKGNNDEKLV